MLGSTVGKLSPINSTLNFKENVGLPNNVEKDIQIISEKEFSRGLIELGLRNRTIFCFVNILFTVQSGFKSPNKFRAGRLVNLCRS